MQRYVAHIDKLREPTTLLDYVWKLVGERGASSFSYHITPIFQSQTSRGTIIYAQGYSPAEQEAYLKGGYRDLDPIPRLTFEFGPILTWSDAFRLGASEPGAAAYLDEMRRRGRIHGASFALFGARNRSGYSSLGFDTAPERLAEGELQLLHGLLQVAHMRICKLLDAQDRGITLSDREREVLEWMAKGKSGTDIATILSLSPETVRTYTKRIYEKLEVGDRVAATVKALQLGLIET